MQEQVRCCTRDGVNPSVEAGEPFVSLFRVMGIRVRNRYGRMEIQTSYAAKPTSNGRASEV